MQQSPSRITLTPSKRSYHTQRWNKVEETARLFWTGCRAVACESGGRRVVPLHLRLWSCGSPGFTGENDQIKAVIGTVSGAAKKRGIYVIADGIGRLFNSCGKWCRKRHVPGTAEMQPELPLFASG